MKGGFSTVEYPANPGYKLLGRDEQPLLLGFSSQPLAAGMVNTGTSSSSTGLNRVKQLFSSFHWDEEMKSTGSSSSSSRDAPWQVAVATTIGTSSTKDDDAVQGSSGGSSCVAAQEVRAVVDILALAAIHRTAKVEVKVVQECKKLLGSLERNAVIGERRGKGGGGEGCSASGGGAPIRAGWYG
jgi:hypothetical protein